jgi:radical SAM superfamily enzyme YgiQ (UPF0313 family)
MKILLVYPKYPQTFWSLKYALEIIDKKAVMPPLGLLTIASILEEHDLKLVDMNVNLITDSDILWADYVFISAMITQKDSAKEVIRKCKYLGTKIVAGGPLFNNLQLEFPEVNHFVLNEGEITLKLFLKDLKSNTLQKNYSSNERPNIDDVPIPKWDLINLNDYAKMPLQFSRGCPFECEFCDIANLNGKIPRVKSPDKFMEELNSLYNSGWRSAIMIVDDNFISNRAKTKKLLEKLIVWRKEKKYPATFVTQISLNLADDDELLLLMQKAGFSAVFIGLETPSVKSLEECSKFHNKNRDMIKDIKKIHKHGMEVYGGFIIGFDQDDETIFDAQFNFIQKSGIVVASVGLLNALPGTKLYSRLKDENRLLTDSSGNNMDCSTNFITKIGNDFLINEYKKLLCSLYSVENFYKRINIFLKDYKNHVSGRFTYYYLKIFLKALYTLGFREKHKLFFWKTFFICIFNCPTSLPKFLTQAIYFVHYEKIFKSEEYKDTEIQNSSLIISSSISTS